MDLPDRVYSLGMDLAGLLHLIAIDDVGLNKVGYSSSARIEEWCGLLADS
jgi:hypothetical protein